MTQESGQKIACTGKLNKTFRNDLCFVVLIHLTPVSKVQTELKYSSRSKGYKLSWLCMIPIYTTFSYQDQLNHICPPTIPISVSTVQSVWVITQSTNFSATHHYLSERYASWLESNRTPRFPSGRSLSICNSVPTQTVKYVVGPCLLPGDKLRWHFAKNE